MLQIRLLEPRAALVEEYEERLQEVQAEAQELRLHSSTHTPSLEEGGAWQKGWSLHQDMSLLDNEVGVVELRGRRLPIPDDEVGVLAQIDDEVGVVGQRGRSLPMPNGEVGVVKQKGRRLHKDMSMLDYEVGVVEQKGRSLQHQALSLLADEVGVMGQNLQQS